MGLYFDVSDFSQVYKYTLHQILKTITGVKMTSVYFNNLVLRLPHHFKKMILCRLLIFNAMLTSIIF